MLNSLDENEFYQIDDQIYFLGSDVNYLTSYLKQNNLKKLFIRFDAKINNLEFLYEMGFLESLSVPELSKDINIEPIYSLKNLTSLDFNNLDSQIEIKQFRNLENIAFNGNSNVLLEGCHSVKNIFIRDLEDFLKIPTINSVKKLKILGYKSIDLKNIENAFPNINDFTLIFAKKLESVFYLKNLKLKTLELEKINDKCKFDDLINCKTIESLYLRTKVGNCNFIEAMPDLKILFCNEVTSGDLTPIFFSELEKAYIKKISKKSTHSKADLKEKFGEW
ncbi:hypothetical protein A4G20_10755 [Pasteurellaceae bacterium RH1A]|nr:hypothetical protein A4G20_10755 [Pasteurellaceae bacterium RH1A]